MMNNFVLANWPAPDNIFALTTTRDGGVSDSPFDSLNLGNNCGDNEMAVNENRSRLCKALGLDREPCWLRQVHGSRVIDVADESEITGAGHEADASISSVAGAGAAVLETAYCEEPQTQRAQPQKHPPADGDRGHGSEAPQQLVDHAVAQPGIALQE